MNEHLTHILVQGFSFRYEWSGLQQQDSWRVRLDRQGDRMIAPSGASIPCAAIDSLLEAFGPRVPVEAPVEFTANEDDRPTYRMRLDLSNGRSLEAYSSSQGPLALPWNLEVDGSLYAQFGGELPRCLFSLLGGLDERWAAFSTREPRYPLRIELSRWPYWSPEELDALLLEAADDEERCEGGMAQDRWLDLREHPSFGVYSKGWSARRPTSEEPVILSAELTAESPAGQRQILSFQLESLDGQWIVDMQGYFDEADLRIEPSGQALSQLIRELNGYTFLEQGRHLLLGLEPIPESPLFSRLKEASLATRSPFPPGATMVRSLNGANVLVYVPGEAWLYVENLARGLDGVDLAALSARVGYPVLASDLAALRNSPRRMSATVEFKRDLAEKNPDLRQALDRLEGYREGGDYLVLEGCLARVQKDGTLLL